ncbi:hypothetical protein M1M11_31900, partial [Pseudomonas azerbaijanoccidens]|uniref:hypothetical protein n=1 Tax=Pseudomonas azerbaijanoccidentalis TaxID=2842347 RepID=UPI00200A4253
MQVNVKAHQEGSFEVVVSVAQAASNINVLDVLGISKETAAIAAGAGIGSVLGVLQWLKGRKLAEVHVNEKTGTAKLITKDNDESECPEAVHKVLSSKTVRNGFDELIYKPLTSEGINSFSVEKNDHPVVT